MIDAEGQSIGLVKVMEIKALPGDLRIDEIIAIENAFKYKADYVYFRRFENRPSIPQIYIYDFSESASTVLQEDLIDLHQRLYSSGHVPMFFVFTHQDVRIFNCYEKPAIGRTLAYKPLATINLAANISAQINDENEQLFKAFSGKTIDNGTFWESSPFSKQFQVGNSAYERLLSELKQALKDIIDQNILPAAIARKMTVISILIKYLEERTDEYNNTVFPKANDERMFVNGKRQRKKFDKNFFDQFSDGATCFTDVLKKRGAAVELLDYLSKHFNGGIFQLSDKERQELKKSDLSRFGLFLEGKLHGIQYVFWRLYSFNDLPVELISNIYEEFLEKKAGVVYTPPYLVNFLLDEVLPVNGLETELKILDPACGSGVFLVGAYRRLIYRWRRRNDWKKPDLSTLKALLKNNIFGSDKDPDAVNLTIFSLALALCDELTPLQIWEDLQFDNLRDKNVYAADFFSLLLAKTFSESTFDLIIGNPPFEAALTPAAKTIDAKCHSHRVTSSSPLPIKLPDNQIALLFLEQSISLCKPGKLVCLIQPSGPLLYNNTSFHFRQHLLLKYHVPQIVDFTHLSRVLFGKGGDVATAAIFVKNEPATDKGLMHITVKRTKPNKEKIYFELDSYDFNYVPRRLALNDRLIWKSNFLGGSRVHQIASRFSKLETIEHFLKRKRTERWVVSEGFTAATKGDLRLIETLYKKRKDSKEDKEKYQKALEKFAAPHLTGRKYLPTDAFREDGIDEKQIMQSLDVKYFHSKGDKKVYEAPHVLIKELAGEKRIPIEFRKDSLAFRNEIIGIHAPKRKEQQLIDFANKFDTYQETFLFYLAAYSGRYMVNKATALLKDDIMKLPNPIQKEKECLELNDFEKIIVSDFHKYLIEFRRNGEKAAIAMEDSKPEHLATFSSVFCAVINSVYSDLKAYDPIETESYICFPFYFNSRPVIEFQNLEQAEESIEKLCRKVAAVNLRLTRVVRFYEMNVIYIIKPKKLRFWLPSVALRDADETFADLRKQGY